MQLYLGAAGLSTRAKFQPPTWLLEIYLSSTLLEIRTGSLLVVGVESTEDVVYHSADVADDRPGTVQSLCQRLCCRLVEMWA